MIIKWKKKSGGNAIDITKAVVSTTWSGSTEQAARTAEIAVINAPYDPNVKKLKLKIAAGDILSLYEDGKNIFYGEVKTIEKKNAVGTVNYQAMDMMDHLLRTNIIKKFKGKTAERIVELLCQKYGIPKGTIVKTKAIIKKLIIDGNSIYEAIMIAYRKASRQTGEKYICYMKGNKFCVGIKGTIVKKLVYSEKENITDVTYTESAEDIINTVEIYNDKGKKIGEVKNKMSLERYGRYNDVYTKEKGVNAKRAAKNMLVGINKQLSIETIETSVQTVAGNGIQMQDYSTGLKGVFWITQDTHKWENGTHTANYDLAFKNMMEKVEG